jgi:hypothetical protein
VKTCSDVKNELEILYDQKESKFFLPQNNLPLFVWAEVWMKMQFWAEYGIKIQKPTPQPFSLFSLLSHLFTLHTLIGRAAAASPLPLCVTAAAAAPRHLPPAQPPNLPAGVR